MGRDDLVLILFLVLFLNAVIRGEFEVKINLMDELSRN